LPVSEQVAAATSPPHLGTSHEHDTSNSSRGSHEISSPPGRRITVGSWWSCGNKKKKKMDCKECKWAVGKALCAGLRGQS